MNNQTENTDNENASSEEAINRSNNSSYEDKKHNFKKGQVLRFVRVRFPGHAKSYPFMIGKRTYQYGQKVIALNDRGMSVGYVNSFPYEIEFHENLLPVRTISKIASDDDVDAKQDSAGKESNMEDLCKDLIKKHSLEMNVTHVELTNNGKKAVFYFTAPARVDFRGLVKDLVSELKMRIELRQISARERSASLGGLGPCGREFCCSSFLTRYGNVNIKMAKTQNLTLVPSKLNGLCGQLKCCVAYEDEVYKEKRTHLPNEGSLIQAKNGDKGKVTKLHVIIEQFDMITEKGVVKRYNYNQFDSKTSPLPREWRMPERFQNVSIETSEVIGLEKEKIVYDDTAFDLDDDDENDENKESKEIIVETKNKQPEENNKRNQDHQHRKRNRNNPFKGRKKNNDSRKNKKD